MSASRSFRMARVAGVASAMWFLAAGVVACGRGAPDRASDGAADTMGAAVDAEPRTADTMPPSADTTPSPATPDTAWTAGIVARAGSSGGAATLAGVRAARHEGFDRVTFEFADGHRPDLHVEYVDRPIYDCGAGNVIPVAGDGWLMVRFTPANAHDEEGRATSGPRALRPALPVVLEVVRICDFEAVVEHVVGVASPNPYRVIELAGPTRIVIDVRHAR